MDFMWLVKNSAFFLSAFLCQSSNFTIINRHDWGAKAAHDHDHMNTPVTVALIHETNRQRCTTEAECIAELKEIQAFHMDNQSKVINIAHACRWFPLKA
jgi:hypothetical protein